MFLPQLGECCLVSGVGWVPSPGLPLAEGCSPVGTQHTQRVFCKTGPGLDLSLCTSLLGLMSKCPHRRVGVCVLLRMVYFLLSSSLFSCQLFDAMRRFLKIIYSVFLVALRKCWSKHTFFIFFYSFFKAITCIT